MATARQVAHYEALAEQAQARTVLQEISELAAEAIGKSGDDRLKVLLKLHRIALEAVKQEARQPAPKDIRSGVAELLGVKRSEVE